MRKASPSTDPFGFFHPAGFIVLGCVGAYWNSLGGPFIWGDQASIIDNQAIRHVWPALNLFSAPNTAVAGHPLVNLSFALNYAMGGVEVAGYHIVNIIIHLCSALVLFGIVRRTLRSEKVSGVLFPGPGLEKDSRPLFGRLFSTDLLALGATLLWAVHPLQSEAVDYVSGRAELLMGLCFFLTIYCAADARGSLHPTHQILWETASVIFCALGMASSELMLAAPVVVLVYDRVFEFESFAEAVRTRRTLYTALAATWLILAWFLWSAGRSPVGLRSVAGLWNGLLNQVEMVAQYLRLAVWPDPLVLDYGPPRALSLAQMWPSAVLCVALAAAAVVAFRRWPATGFLGVAFFLTLAPGALFGQAFAEVGSEPRMYVALAPLSVLAVAGAGCLTGWLAAHFPRRSRFIAGTAIDLVFAVLLVCAVRTVYRNEQYGDPVALWSSSVAERPHGRSRYELGTSLIAAGSEDEGIEQLRRAAPDVPAAKYSLGNELYAVGKMDEAARVLQELLRHRAAGTDPLATRLLLARTLMAQGKLEESSTEFETILRTAPSNGAAREGLTELGTAQRIVAADLLRRQRLEEAVAHAREAVRLLPADAEAHATLGSALAAHGKPDEAIVQFREALRIDPGQQEAQSGLVGALGQLRSGRK